VTAAKSMTAALDAWVLASLPRAVAFARSLVRDDATADDLVQECYCKLLYKAGEYDLPRDGTRLLFTALTRACIDRSRRQRASSLDTLLDGDPNDSQFGMADPRALAPEAIAQQNELEAALDDALGQLPLTQRAALELKGLGYSLREIAQALDVSESNAGVLIYRARQTLAGRLMPYRDEVVR